ncbi:MAG: M23 family metallopeptidase [Spirochaetaceae bacterium]|jgi:murein DD-endopeptidase MepM/ murein hydrolase activator NlpD|nr:M23 family metallopeptidase [Spirochaetaceae bacterium]
MQYLHDNLAAYIPQHVTRREKKPLAKQHSRGNWNEAQTVAQSRTEPYRTGRSYNPVGESVPGVEIPVQTPAQGFPNSAGKKAKAARHGSRSDVGDIQELVQENIANTVSIEEKSNLGIFSLKALLIVLLITALAIFSYNALLWQRNYDALAPAEDNLAQAEMHNYVMPVQPPAGESDAIPLPMTETFSWTDYAVQRGDSISKIAASYDLSMDAIVASNNIARARALREGEVLRIPNMDGIPVTVQRGDSLTKIGAAHGVPVTAILDANDLDSEQLTEGSSLFIPGAKMNGEELRAVIGDLFIYPVRGRLSSPFGWRSDPISGERRYHAAIDLAANMGTPVKASMDGRVTSVGFNSTYGNYIIITHSGGYQTMYAHLSVVSVENNQYVVQGREIGKVGSTGYSTGPHLHFALYKNSRSLNPLDYLKL